MLGLDLIGEQYASLAARYPPAGTQPARSLATKFQHIGLHLAITWTFRMRNTFYRRRFAERLISCLIRALMVRYPMTPDWAQFACSATLQPQHTDAWPEARLIKDNHARRHLSGAARR